MISIGRIDGAFGVRGEVKVSSFSDDPEALLDYATLWLGSDASSVQKKVCVAGRRHGGRAVIRFEGLDTPEQAQKLVGQQVWVAKEDLLDPGEDAHYWVDLIGCQVLTEEGEYVGVVEDLMSTGANDVLILREGTGLTSSGQERLLPFIRDVVLEVNSVEKRILVRLMPGL
ncbi:MAG: ribosome maturation factor RimM [Magnetococcus sp. DMHC-6]